MPDSDLFRVLRNGSASITTGRIARFVKGGIELESGEVVEADVIVTATGLNLLALGGIELEVDGEPVAIGETYTYKGLMLGNVPNFAFCVGYTNASWTLRADLSSTFVCRILNRLDATHTQVARPELAEGALQARPILDLTSGYVRRARRQVPETGQREALAPPAELPPRLAGDALRPRRRRHAALHLSSSTRVTRRSTDSSSSGVGTS